MSVSPTPQWQPIARLALVARHIDGMLETDIEQYENLKLARSKPWVLDDYTVARVQSSLTVQRDDLWLFDEQLRRWASESLTSAQRSEVNRLVGQMSRLHEVIDEILRLADELKRGTIEQQLTKSDIEIAIGVLRKSGFPGQPGESC